MSITLAQLADELNLTRDQIIEEVTAYARTGALAIEPYEPQRLTQRCAETIRGRHTPVVSPTRGLLDPDRDTIRNIALETITTTREVLSRVTALIQEHGYDAVILEDDCQRPANALLHRRYADALRTQLDAERNAR